jgi:hypothetical protein
MIAAILLTTWVSLAPAAVARQEVGVAAANGKLYLIGGIASDTSILSSVESFDITNATWRSEPLMANPRHGIGAALIGTRIHIPAGSPIQGFGTTNEHDALELAVGRRRAVGR